MCALLQVYSNADVARGLVAQAPDAVYFFVAHQVGDAHYEVCFVDPIRDACDYDLEVAFFTFHNFGIAAHHHPALAG